MKITEIKQQQKQRSRYSVFVDDEYSFSLTESQIIELGLKVGQELTSKEISKLKEEAEFGKIFELCLSWLTLRPRSEYELDLYLQRKSVSPKIAAKVKKRTKELNFIDDAKFAEAWIRSRQLLKPISKLAIKRELAQKRVPLEIIEAKLKDAQIDEEYSAKRLANNKRKQSRYQDKRKLKQYLYRKGYSWDIINKVIDELD